MRPLAEGIIGFWMWLRPDRYHRDDQRFNSCIEKKECVELLKGYWWLIVVFGLLALQAARKYMVKRKP